MIHWMATISISQKQYVQGRLTHKNIGVEPQVASPDRLLSAALALLPCDFRLLDSGPYCPLAAALWYPQVRTCRQEQCDYNFGCSVVEGVSKSGDCWEMSAQAGLQAPGGQGSAPAGPWSMVLLRLKSVWLINQSPQATQCAVHSGPRKNFCADRVLGRALSWTLGS